MYPTKYYILHIFKVLLDMINKIYEHIRDLICFITFHLSRSENKFNQIRFFVEKFGLFYRAVARLKFGVLFVIFFFSKVSPSSFNKCDRSDLKAI